MKKLFVLFVFGVFALGLSASVIAQAQTTDNATGENILETSAGTLPDSPFYGLKKFGEGIQTFFTFDRIEKAKLKYRLAQLRLAEAEAMSRLGKAAIAENMIKEYENGLADVEADENTISAAGRNASAIADLVGNNTYRHILVLQKVYEKVPDSAKTAIRKVIENSMERQSKMAEKLAGNNTVNITITVGNETVTREVLARFAEKFLENARELKNKVKEEVKIENEDTLKGKIAEKIEIAKDKVLEQINDSKEKLAKIENNITADANITALNKVINEAKTHLNAAENAFNDGKYREAYNHAILAEKALNVAKKIINNTEDIEKAIAEKLEVRNDKAQEQILDAKKQINMTEQKLVNITNTTANKLLSQAKEHLSKAEQAFNNTKYGDAFGQAVAAEWAAKNAEKLMIIKVRCPEIKCIHDPCPGEHIPNLAGCVNCASPCRKTSQNKTEACIQVITPAISPEGICKEFPTSCLPEGWKRVEKCPSSSGSAMPSNTVCTADVKQCPDGSYVRRNPNANCAFYSCPTSSAP